MGKGRPATVAIIAGGIGLLVGRLLLARLPSSDHFGGDTPIPQVWTRDPDLRLSLALNLVLLGLAAWHLQRFGLGKLIVIGLLAAGAFQFTLFDFGDGDPFWSEGYSGDELVGGWLVIASAVVVLIGVVWSYVGERPTEATFLSLFFSEGRADGGAEGQPSSDGRWLASDGEWYPPERHPDFVPPPPGAQRPRTLRLRRGWVILIGVFVGYWIFGQVFNNEKANPATEMVTDRGPVQDEWSYTAALDDEGVVTHGVHMIKTISPLEEADAQDLGGRLVWPETEIELCGVEIQSVGDGFVQIGNYFPAREECEPIMVRAFEDFGVPETACLFVRSNGVVDEYCAPLDVSPQTVAD